MRFPLDVDRRICDEREVLRPEFENTLVCCIILQTAVNEEARVHRPVHFFFNVSVVHDWLHTYYSS